MLEKSGWGGGGRRRRRRMGTLPLSSVLHTNVQILHSWPPRKARLNVSTDPFYINDKLEISQKQNI